MLEDELMSEPEVHGAFFQFNDEEPVQFAFVAGGEFSLTLKTVDTQEPSVEFTDGNGKSFKIFLKTL